jgi:hypothetical protein
LCQLITPATVRRYDEAWVEPDQVARLATLAEVWADDGAYVDPEVPEGVRGWAAQSDLITSSHEELPGLSIQATSDLLVLGDRAWYRWEATTTGGEAFDGVDFVEFAPDGRIARLTNFYDGSSLTDAAAAGA